MLHVACPTEQPTRSNRLRLQYQCRVVTVTDSVSWCRIRAGRLAEYVRRRRLSAILTEWLSTLVARRLLSAYWYCSVTKGTERGSLLVLTRLAMTTLFLCNVSCCVIRFRDIHRTT